MFFQSTAIVILLVFYGCYYMKLKIAFLQLLPGAAIEDNIELQMAIAITLLEKHEPNPRNTVCLFDRHGKLVYRYSKVHIFFWSRTLIFLTPPSPKISALPESFSVIRISA